MRKNEDWKRKNRSQRSQRRSVRATLLFYFDSSFIFSSFLASDRVDDTIVRGPNPRNQGILGAMLASRCCIIPSRTKRIPEGSAARGKLLHARSFSNPFRRQRKTRDSTVMAIASGGTETGGKDDSVNDKSAYIQALGLEDIGVDVDELSRFEPLA